MENIKQSTRIQTSFLNAAEKKALVWMASRMPAWVTSNMLTAVGTLGSILVAVGCILSSSDIKFLWLSCFGLVLNWFGDSLDGTIARVRKTQRPVFGYYLDHTMDVFNEFFMFVGLGLSPMMNMAVAVALYTAYLALTINVSIDAHLKKEFKLTYAKLGPTEFRVIGIILLVVWMYAPSLRTITWNLKLAGISSPFGVGDIFGAVVLVILVAIYLCSVAADLRYYSKVDPLHKDKSE